MNQVLVAGVLLLTISAFAEEKNISKERSSHQPPPSITIPVLNDKIIIQPDFLKKPDKEKEVLRGSEGVGGGDALTDSAGHWTLLDLGESLPYEYFVPIPAFDSFIHFPVDSKEAQDAADAYGNALFVLENMCDASIKYNYKFNDQDFSKQLSSASVINYLYARLSAFVGSSYRDPVRRSSSRLSENEAKLIRTRLAQQLVWVKTQAPLENIPDEGVSRLLADQMRQQVAVQKEGAVMVYDPIFKDFSPKDKAALVLHETILHLVFKINPNHHDQYGTQYLRQLVRLLFDENALAIGKPAFDRLCGHQGLVLKDFEIEDKEDLL